MSKTQWKKKLKHQKKLKKWEKMKQESKVRRKERQSLLKKERQALGGLPPPKKTRLEDGGSSKSSQRGSYKKMSDEGASSVRVAVDCSFEQLMSAKDQLKLIKQLQRCYAANRRSVAPLQYYVTSFGGQLKSELDCRYLINKEHEHWDIHYRSEDFLEVFGKENVVYLLAESTNVLNELDPSKAYIIGGLVDHNHHKGHCYQVAEEKGLAHARLPISEYIRMSGRKVLTINHVYEILLDYSTNGGDWKKAFFKVLPPRKLKSTSNADIETENQLDQNPPADVNQSPSENIASTEIDTNIKIEPSSPSKCNNDLPESTSSDSVVPSEGVSCGGVPVEGVPSEGGLKESSNEEDAWHPLSSRTLLSSVVEYTVL
ncbi:tRNA methyltransferase 10 homolog A-like isoform X4 [Halichondria panicea]